MNIRSIKALALQLAKLSAQDDAAKESRWIWRESDFTVADSKKITVTQQGLVTLFASASGKSWTDNLLPGVQALCPNLRLGFKAQDQCVARLRRAGVLVES